MGDLLQPTHLLIIAIVLLVLFGGKKLPELGKGLGEGMKGFREGLKGVSDPSPATPSVQQYAAPAPPAASTQVQSEADKANMEYVTCNRCGNRFENPLGFKVADYVCRTCQKSS
ncbi:MAG TPA: twin-arginine translocase TatA/TatE family subunit [Terracidiphilus sp.]|jgi:sec-independent protein translocase protein TatA|nr:twin-arginine translocase TatA/TatE family subunit [Terracidiphilus sp.]